MRKHFLLLAALFACSAGVRAAEVLEKTGTLWEFDSPTASCNHGFASYIALVLADGPRQP